jgi:hypothetical protein
MEQEAESRAGFQPGISGETFDREMGMCAKLYRENGGKCCWGKCADCGVIPLLTKLRVGKLLEAAQDVEQAKAEVFKD